MKYTFLLLILPFFCVHAQEGFNSWKEYGLKGKVKTMKVNYTNYEQSEIYSYRQYFFSENGALDSIFYQSAGDYAQHDLTQIFYHTNGKTDSAKLLDKNRSVLNSLEFKWITDHKYLEINHSADSTKMESEITLSETFRDWKRENKTYKNNQLIQWDKYENTLSSNDLITISFTENLLDGTNEKKCAEYISYDKENNPTESIIYLICDNKKYWIRYQKEYEYYK